MLTAPRKVRLTFLLHAGTYNINSSFLLLCIITVLAILNNVQHEIQRRSFTKTFAKEAENQGGSKGNLSMHKVLTPF